MDPVVHFEMPAEDSRRMSDFYSTAFGWQTQMMGEEMGNYVLVHSTPTGKNGMPDNPGAINGGFYPKQSSDAKYPSFVINVKNIQESMQKVTAAGGKLIGEPHEIPGVGTFISFFDTEGNRCSILQPPSK